MKKLVLVRHAKSSWDNPTLSDHARPLASRGLRDAPLMGKRIKNNSILPDLIISSDAERAKETAFVFGEILKYPKEKIVLTKNLYHAATFEIISVIRSVSSDVEVLFIFGHNPGMNELMWKMGGKLDNLPTTGIFAVNATITDWKDFETSKVEFWFEDYPKKF
ncbi:SixA phosphatase family protein [Mongoliitalea daihaiensis]|uniref:SixA phosphatase family protein n=1 Tax=Mongoliitalea daihaiensis TaxID=2782006 RepID=UPI001F358FDA|nr:histidine phosphatase family protein [Mongoliitalea daihaiensis]UJP66879.1 histidine phosphatase family protein [Mongoliitalea daihaiensis]